MGLTSPSARRNGTQPPTMYRATHSPPGRRQAQVAPDKMSECSASFGGGEARCQRANRTTQPGCERASRGSRHRTPQLYTSPSPRSSSGMRVCHVSQRGQVLSRDACGSWGMEGVYPPHTFGGRQCHTECATLYTMAVPHARYSDQGMRILVAACRFRSIFIVSA